MCQVGTHPGRHPATGIREDGPERHKGNHSALEHLTLPTDPGTLGLSVKPDHQIVEATMTLAQLRSILAGIRNALRRSMTISRLAMSDAAVTCCDDIDQVDGATLVLKIGNESAATGGANCAGSIGRKRDFKDDF